MQIEIILGGDSKTITITNEQTWGDVINTASKQGINILTKHTARLAQNKAILDAQSILPKSLSKAGVALELMHVFVTPIESKGGSEISYKEVRAKIQSLIAEHGEDAKSHFNDGKNYTTKSTKELNELYNSWKEEEEEDETDDLDKDDDYNDGITDDDDDEIIEEQEEVVVVEKVRKQTVYATTVKNDDSIYSKLDKSISLTNEALQLLKEVKKELDTVVIFNNIK